jgi:hypothetical protein
LIAVLVSLSELNDQAFVSGRQYVLWVFALAAPASTLIYAFSQKSIQ